MRAVRRCVDGRQDYFQNAAEILGYVNIPETQHAPAMLLKPPCAIDIALSDRGVLATVELDDQRSFSTNEIDHVPSDRHLAPKFVAGELPIPNS